MSKKNDYKSIAVWLLMRLIGSGSTAVTPELSDEIRERLSDVSEGYRRRTMKHVVGFIRENGGGGYYELIDEWVEENFPAKVQVRPSAKGSLHSDEGMEIEARTGSKSGKVTSVSVPLSEIRNPPAKWVASLTQDGSILLVGVEEAEPVATEEAAAA